MDTEQDFQTNPKIGDIYSNGMMYLTEKQIKQDRPADY
jgi:hypothetical protein